MGEPTEVNLLQAIKESLDRDGTLGRFKGELRAAVMSILSKNDDQTIPPRVPDETRLINELLREYLVWNGYIYTEQVLSSESGQTGERVGRDILTTKLGVIDDAKTAKIPLLYYIISAFQNIDDK